MRPPRRVLHIITRLIVGGVQENTILTVKALNTPDIDQGRYTSILACGTQTGPEGSLVAEAESRGVHVELVPSLRREINPAADLASFFRLMRLMRDKKENLSSRSSTLIAQKLASLAVSPQNWQKFQS